jgi:DNA-binding winged helix-turn-helix (wHTH) protein
MSPFFPYFTRARVGGTACTQTDPRGMIYLFENFALDTDRRELRRGGAEVSLEPQVFDLLEYLIRNRERVVSKDDLLASVWHGRIVSESTLSTRISAARSAIGDSGEQQRLIKTLSRKGIRFVGSVSEHQGPQRWSWQVLSRIPIVSRDLRSFR